MGGKPNPLFSKSSNNTKNPTRDRSVRILNAADIEKLLSPERCLNALEAMYRNLHNSPADNGASLGFHTSGGKIHVKAGLSPHTHRYFVAKINANFLDNPKRYDLPTIQGLIVLSSGLDGQPLAVLQSGVLTGIRTAAASALAAKYCARKSTRYLTVVGCGAQAPYQVAAMAGIRDIERVTVFDLHRERAEALARWTQTEMDTKADVAETLAMAVKQSDICVTCTTSSVPLLDVAMVPKGCFIAAVGADNPDKHEIDPALFQVARIVVDDPDQCLVSGDLAHAVKTFPNDLSVVTLAELASGTVSGRRCEDDIVIFDSTGVGVQDVAAAGVVYELACKQHAGTPILMEE